MANIAVEIPGAEKQVGEAPIVILGPNGSGKTKLAQRIADANQVEAISAQRRTWVDEHLPVQTPDQLRNNVLNHVRAWRNRAWQPTEEFNFVMSRMVQEHTDILTTRNEEAVVSGQPIKPVRDTKLIQLQTLWSRIFPERKLEILGFFPKVKRLDAEANAKPYLIQEMSDGERTVLYMAARVLTADQPIVLVDEPELHMHSRLAVQFWNEAERLRPDCRFVYVTHDLNFTLSRYRATVLIARSGSTAETVLVDDLPMSVASEILGAATLPFFAKRIFFYEGASDSVFASELINAWFNENETFAIPAGGRDSVCAAVSGLRSAGVAAAQVLGLVDRDFYSEAINTSMPEGVSVLPLHEIESVLCDREAVSGLASHLGKDPKAIWDEFLTRVRNEFCGKTLNSVVANRVRARVGDLLEGAFSGSQIDPNLRETCSNHCRQLSNLDLPSKTQIMFAEEGHLVEAALDKGDETMLAVLPGKHLLALLARILGFRNTTELTSLVVKALDPKSPDEGKPLEALAVNLECALAKFLPPRKSAPSEKPTNRPNDVEISPA